MYKITRVHCFQPENEKNMNNLQNSQQLRFPGGKCTCNEWDKRKYPQYSLKIIVLISTWDHGLCSMGREKQRFPRETASRVLFPPQGHRTQPIQHWVHHSALFIQTSIITCVPDLSEYHHYLYKSLTPESWRSPQTPLSVSPVSSNRLPKFS